MCALVAVDREHDVIVLFTDDFEGLSYDGFDHLVGCLANDDIDEFARRRRNPGDCRQCRGVVTLVTSVAAEAR